MARRNQTSERSQFSLLTIFIAGAGWLAAIFLGLLDLPAKINSFMTEAPKATENVASWWRVDKNFTGTWTSDLEGVVDATDAERDFAGLEGGPVSVKIRVYDGELSGEISAEKELRFFNADASRKEAPRSY